jgi:Zn-dependent protease with chaperone function
MFATIYWHLWYKLGPSLAKELLNRAKGKKRKIKIKNSEIEKFLKELDYEHFYVIESEVAYGMAHPLNKEVLISSKIYDSGNTNLIKYVLAHEVAHKRQGNTKGGVVYFTFWIICFLIVYLKFHPFLTITLLRAFIVGRIAMFFQRKFEDMADREAARILGKEKVAQAIKDIFILNKTSLEKRSWWWDKLVINRDFPSRMKAIRM